MTLHLAEHADCIITPTVTWDYLDKLRDAEDKRQEESPNCTASVVSWCQCYYQCLYLSDVSQPCLLYMISSRSSLNSIISRVRAVGLPPA